MQKSRELQSCRSKETTVLQIAECPVLEIDLCEIKCHSDHLFAKKEI